MLFTHFILYVLTTEFAHHDHNYKKSLQLWQQTGPFVEGMAQYNQTAFQDPKILYKVAFWGHFWPTVPTIAETVIKSGEE